MQDEANLIGDASAVERGCDFLAIDGWKGEGGKRIVDHGGRGRPREAERAGVSNRILRRFSALCCTRQPSNSAIMNKPGWLPASSGHLWRGCVRSDHWHSRMGMAVAPTPRRNCVASPQLSDKLQIAPH